MVVSRRGSTARHALCLETSFTYFSRLSCFSKLPVSARERRRRECFRLAVRSSNGNGALQVCSSPSDAARLQDPVRREPDFICRPKHGKGGSKMPHAAKAIVLAGCLWIIPPAFSGDGGALEDA